MNKKKIIPIIVVITALVLSILYFEVFRYIGENGDIIEGSGTIEVTEIDISSKLSGRVVHVAKTEGEDVKRLEILVKLEYNELDAQRLSLLANLRNVQKNLSRIQRLYKTGSISKKDYDNMLTSYQVARAKYSQINASIGNAVIPSPISGTVLQQNLELGEMAFPGTSILTIADLNKVWIKIYVPANKLGFVKIGQKASVFIDSFPEKAFPGKVVSISNRAEFTPKTIQTQDERTKLMFAVKIRVNNPKHILKPGMPADATILMEKKQ